MKVTLLLSLLCLYVVCATAQTTQAWVTTGTQCSAVCAPGYGAGTSGITGTVTCNTGSYGVSQFSGCAVNSCSPYAQYGYTISGCGSSTSLATYGNTCTATCASGFTGTVAGAVSCSSAQYVGMAFTGCTVNSCPAYSQVGYTIGTCGGTGTIAYGTSCSATCASGYTGTVTGTVGCASGGYTSYFSGCVSNSCPALTQVGYTIGTCSAATVNGGTTCTASCASGYTGTVTGTVTCTGSTGYYSGSFSGCSVPASCTAYSQGGYTVSSNCGGNTVAVGTVCTASCASGYTGTVTGSVSCSSSYGGSYTNTFSGCTVNSCYAYTQTGYSINACGGSATATIPFGTTCSATCAAGYTGTVTGAVSCSSTNAGGYSSYFSGCVINSCPAYSQVGYNVNSCGGSATTVVNYATTCSATCATGYSGTVSGAVSCSASQYSGQAFTGCVFSSCSPFSEAGYTIGSACNPSLSAASHVTVSAFLFSTLIIASLFIAMML
jgi:hypothetical protein